MTLWLWMLKFFDILSQARYENLSLCRKVNQDLHLIQSAHCGGGNGAEVQSRLGFPKPNVYSFFGGMLPWMCLPYYFWIKHDAACKCEIRSTMGLRGSFRHQVAPERLRSNNARYIMLESYYMKWLVLIQYVAQFANEAPKQYLCDVIIILVCVNGIILVN